MSRWIDGMSYDAEVASALMRYKFDTKWGPQPFGVLLGWNWSTEIEAAIRRVIAEPEFKPSLPVDIINVGHQAGGHSCDTVGMIGVAVDIQEQIHGSIKSLCQRFFQSHGGWFTRHCTDMILDVESAIAEERLTIFDNAIGRNCIMEGVYPIAANQHNVSKVVQNHQLFMHDMAPLFGDSDLSKQLALFIVAENSD